MGLLWDCAWVFYLSAETTRVSGVRLRCAKQGVFLGVAGEKGLVVRGEWS